MTLIDDVLSFARDYINKPSARTKDRKNKIRDALHQLSGENLVTSCGVCYIEALFEIIKFTKMASSKYVLKKGVVLQAFGDPSKTCTNNTITDELGDWYAKNHPEKLVYFERYPDQGSFQPPQPIRVVPPVNIIPPEKIIVPGNILLTDEQKQLKLDELKKSLKLTKDGLVDKAKGANLPESEWVDLNKPDLTYYLYEKLATLIK